MGKKKILHLVNTLGNDGTSKVVLELCNLFNQNFEFHIVALKGGFISLPEKFSFIKIHSFTYQEDDDYSLRGYLRNLLFKRRWRTSYAEVIAKIKELQPDIIHCHVQPRELMIIKSSKVLRSKKLLYTDHSTRIQTSEYSWVKRQLLAWVYRRIYKKFHVVAVSKSVYNYHCHFKITSKRRHHWLVSNSVDTEIFNASNFNKVGPVRVIYVARLHAKKGHEVLIKAWALVNSKTPAKLLLVGSGPEEIRLKRLASTVGSPNPIDFIGDTSDVLPFLQSSNIGVFPSLNEGLPLSLLEKMSCKLPVIASNIPEFHGIIRNEENGLFYKSGDFHELAGKLTLLIDNLSLRERLGENARQFVIRNYSNDEFRRSYQRVYNTIIS